MSFNICPLKLLSKHKNDKSSGNSSSNIEVKVGLVVAESNPKHNEFYQITQDLRKTCLQHNRLKEMLVLLVNALPDAQQHYLKTSKCHLY